MSDFTGDHPGLRNNTFLMYSNVCIGFVVEESVGPVRLKSMLMPQSLPALGLTGFPPFLNSRLTGSQSKNSLMQGLNSVVYVKDSNVSQQNTPKLRTFFGTVMQNNTK